MRAVLVAMVTACNAGSASIDAAVDTRPRNCSPTIGDPAQPIELEILDAAGAVVTEGATVRLTAPVQGGLIVLLGARARNLDGCDVQLTAALRDPVSTLIVGLEQRPASLVAGLDGWGQPENRDYDMANVAVCPNFSGARDIHEQPWQAEVTVESGGRSATLARSIVPTCVNVPDFARCPCICSVGGDCATPDAAP